jgi:phosphoribosylamine--glycine ligase
MKVLIIGSGGREHALAAAYAKSDRVRHVYVVPGNGLMSVTESKITTFPDIAATDFSSLLQLARTKKVDLVDVAPDEALALGFVDTFTKEKIPAFGPTRAAAEIEWNKEWSRMFMQKYRLPTPRFASFADEKKALAYIKQLPEQTLFIKASGLALGKGVIKAAGRDAARKAIERMRSFGAAGKTFLIEAGMIGEEFSLFALCDGTNFVILSAAQDHKTVFNADSGPNTGGMGCVAPTGTLSEPTMSEIMRRILKTFMAGMQAEGRPYTGILYLGGMLTKTGVKIVEFNARWGDPETEVIVPGMRSDYLAVVEATLGKKLAKVTVAFDENVRVSIAGCARGYPTDYAAVKGKEVYGLPEVLSRNDIRLFGAGISRKGRRFVVNGGRVFHLVGEGKTIAEARERAYGAMSLLSIAGNNLHYRTDIGWREKELRKHS